jgi:hypothetical protein
LLYTVELIRLDSVPSEIWNSTVVPSTQEGSPPQGDIFSSQQFLVWAIKSIDPFPLSRSIEQINEKFGVLSVTSCFLLFLLSSSYVVARRFGLRCTNYDVRASSKALRFNVAVTSLLAKCFRSSPPLRSLQFVGSGADLAKMVLP